MRPRSAARLTACVLALHAASASAGTGTVWFNYQLLDDRSPLEIGTPTFDTTLFESYSAVVYNGELDLLIVDLSDPGNPIPRLEDIVTGSTFAVGRTSALAPPADLIGGSFVDGDFDLMFWTCAPPCANVTIHPVNTALTWVDSQSAAVGSDFFSGGLDYGGGVYVITYSPDGGTTWLPYRNVAPPGGMYAAFDGGERATLVVDPAATDRNTAVNCLFYEFLTGGGTATQKRLNCAAGTTPFWDALVTTDVPNPTMSFDLYIENACSIMRPPGTTPAFVTCLFNRRQSADSWIAIYNLTGQLQGLERLGGVPNGQELFGYGIYEYDEFFEILSASGVGQPANNWVYRGNLTSIELENGPAMTPGAVAALQFTPPVASEYRNRLVAALYKDLLSPPPGDGTWMSLKEVPQFFDGFESGNPFRWSGHFP